ncbi:MAG: NERD domain-containing protein [Pseudoxanthomonas mexicana]|nr:NERD domain-containing protein [Pseudoxanthomonas mexicana]
MLIKKADDKQDLLAELERQGSEPGVKAKHAREDFHRMRAGIKGEQESAYHIDFHYGDTNRNWFVLHDLRLEHAGRVAQIDHLLVNRFMEFYVLESKHFNDGVRITGSGDFERWNGYRKAYEGMPSPLEQNERHIQVLRDVVRGIELPTRLGVRLEPRFHSLILISASARIKTSRGFDASRVIKTDQLKQSIQRDIQTEGVMASLASMAKIVSRDTAEFVARRLAACHRPLQRACPPRPPVPPPLPAAVPAVEAAPAMTDATPGPVCKACQKNAGSIEYGKYGYYFKCAACGTNTGIRFTCQPGHAPRLRKRGDDFLRDCPQCGTSTSFHSNTPVRTP